MYVASNGIKTAVILRDSDPESPRNWDNCTNMVCWHTSYSLGDSHNYKEPLDFAQSMVNKHLTQKDVFCAIVNNELSDFRVTEDVENNCYSVEVRGFLNPEDWRKVYWKISQDFEAIVSDDTEFDFEYDILDSCYPDELLRLCKEHGNVEILPLYLYDHSGITMSTSEFSCNWDSGQVGYIYIDKETVINEFPDAKDSDWRECAIEHMKADVQIYDNYLTDEVYGYNCFEGLDETDSCWGYYPGADNIENIMNEELRGWFGSDLHFKYDSGDNFDIDEFFAENDFPELREKIKADVNDFILSLRDTASVWPFAYNADEVLSNKDGVFDDIVENIYEEHVEYDANCIYENIVGCAGASRDIEPKISVCDLNPNQDYTASEIVEIINRKSNQQKLVDELIENAVQRSKETSNIDVAKSNVDMEMEGKE